jgi:hypothetical protein
MRVAAPGDRRGMAASANHSESGGRDVRIKGKRRADAAILHQDEAERVGRRQLVKIGTIEAGPGAIEVPGRCRQDGEVTEARERVLSTPGLSPATRSDRET